MKRKDIWTCKELDILRREFPKRTNAEMAKLIKRSPTAIVQKASKLGIKKQHYGIEWTPQMIKLLRDFFPVMFNEALAKWIGVSQRSLIRKARELGIDKAPDFFEKRRQDISRKAAEALKERGDREGTWFKKGVRHNPAGEFKPGHKESPETKAKRSAALKAAWAQKKKLNKSGIKYEKI